MKSFTKERDYPTFTTEDILFLFGDITCPVGFVLNCSDPSECFALLQQQHLFLRSIILIRILLGWELPCCCLLDNHMLVCTQQLVNSWKTKPWMRGKSMNSYPLSLRNQRVLKAHSLTLPSKGKLSQ